MVNRALGGVLLKPVKSTLIPSFISPPWRPLVLSSPNSTTIIPHLTPVLKPVPWKAWKRRSTLTEVTWTQKVQPPPRFKPTIGRLAPRLLTYPSRHLDVFSPFSLLLPTLEINRLVSKTMQEDLPVNLPLSNRPPIDYHPLPMLISHPLKKSGGSSVLMTLMSIPLACREFFWTRRTFPRPIPSILVVISPRSHRQPSLRLQPLPTW